MSAFNRNVQLTSNDGRSFTLSEEVCSISEHISNTLNISDPDEELPVLDIVQINGANMEVIVDFMRMYAANPIPTPLEKPVVFANLPKYATDLLDSLKMVAGNMKDLTNTEVSLMSLLYGANILQISILKQLLMAKLVDSVRNKNMRQLNALFGLPDDYTINHAELRDIQEKYAYAFETSNS